MENDTMTKLIVAATPLFARKGYSGVSIRELSDAAEVNVAAISYHFGGKEALYNAVVEEQFSPIAQMLDKIQDLGKLTAEQRLELYANGVIALHGMRPYLIRFMHSELTNPTGAFEIVVKKYIRRAFKFLIEALADGVKEGIFKPDLDLGFAAMSLAGIINFYFIGKPLAKEFLPVREGMDGQYVRQAFTVYLDGIRRKGDE